MSTGARSGWLVAALAGFGAGLAGGLFGVGGGIVMVPVLTAFFGLTQHQAHGTSLAAVAATALAGIVVYGLSGHVAWLPAALMAVSGAFTARLGARLAARTGRERLALAFAWFVLAMGVRILWRAPVGEHAALSGGPFSGPVGIAAALAVGAAVGLLAGYMGVGGGVIAVPALTLLFGMSQQTAQGTSLALILGSAPFGAVEHARHGNVDQKLLPGLMLGALLGAPLASWAAQRLPQATLARGFAIFLIANALRMMWAARAGRAPKAGSGSQA